MRCTTKRVLRGAGVGVLVLSLALTGCQGKKKNKRKNRGSSSTSHSRTVGGSAGRGSGGGGSLTGAQDASAVLPTADRMPAALRTVTDEPSSRAKAPTNCKQPSAKCRNAVAYGDAGYGSADRSKGAGFDVVVYRNAKAAAKAFKAWDNYARTSGSTIQMLNTQAYDTGSFTFQYKKPARENTQETVILRGKYIGVLDYRAATNSPKSGASSTLTGLSRMYTERLRQVAAHETPTASAAGIKVA